MIRLQPRYVLFFSFSQHPFDERHHLIQFVRETFPLLSLLVSLDSFWGNNDAGMNMNFTPRI